MDALIASGLSTRDGLRVTAADINPRVTEWMTRRARHAADACAGYRYPRTGARAAVPGLSRLLRELGRAIGAESTLRGVRSRPSRQVGCRVARGVTEALDAATLDITVERIDARYDLIVVTNVFPYLTDAGAAACCREHRRHAQPGGVLIHNEPRPALADALHALAMPLLQSRSGVVATVEGGAPLYDAAWMHGASYAAK